MATNPHTRCEQVGICMCPPNNVTDTDYQDALADLLREYVNWGGILTPGRKEEAARIITEGQSTGRTRMYGTFILEYAKEIVDAAPHN